jgi:hypothetical protein
MRLSGLHDACIRALYVPVLVNGAAIFVGAPLAAFTRLVPAEALTAWCWGSFGLSGLIFLLTVFDMRAQRAVQAFNARSRESAHRQRLLDFFTKKLMPDIRLSLLWKLLFIEYATLGVLMRSNAGPVLFAALFGILPVFFDQIKFDLDIQARVRDMFPNSAGDFAPVPPPAQLVARVRLAMGIAGMAICGLLAFVHFGMGVSVVGRTRGWVPDGVFEYLVAGSGAVFAVMAAVALWPRKSGA